MAHALTIPEIVESEPMLSLSANPDGKTFGVTINVGDTAVRLMHASSTGQHLPLVVLTTDSQILALDSVFVTDVSTGDNSVVHVTFVADSVRFV